MRPNPGRWPIERMRLPELGTVPGGDGREGTLPLAARTGLHAFLRRPAESASGVRRESRFRDANGVRDPNVPEFALRAELVDGGGADCRLPKLVRDTGRRDDAERRWAQCPSYSLSWEPRVLRSEPAPISRLRTWRSGSNSPCSAITRSGRGSGASIARSGYGSPSGGPGGARRSTSFAPRQ